MKKAVHFGAGNIGRGFIGQVLYDNDFEIAFIDVNETIIDALNEKQGYTIEIAQEGQPKIQVSRVRGINNAQNPDQVIQAIAEADLITTAIGPNILPFIAEVLARGLEARLAQGNHQNVDVFACENMIGGSSFLAQEVDGYLSEAGKAYVAKHVGFPNAAVDRIVPAQSHEDPLYVVVEPFKEWVVETKGMKNPELRLEQVHYEEDLEPFIERKLFSVNSGHATSAYTGAQAGAKTILEALQNPAVKEQVEAVLAEIRSLLMAKWGFEQAALEDYHRVIISRFENPYIVDDITRVARTPIRKLSYDERFIRPIRELAERKLSYQHLLETVAAVFAYRDPNDPQALELQELLASQPLKEVVVQVTGLEEGPLLEAVVAQLAN